MYIFAARLFKMRSFCTKRVINYYHLGLKIVGWLGLAGSQLGLWIGSMLGLGLVIGCYGADRPIVAVRPMH